MVVQLLKQWLRQSGSQYERLLYYVWLCVSRVDCEGMRLNQNMCQLLRADVGCFPRPSRCCKVMKCCLAWVLCRHPTWRLLTFLGVSMPCATWWHRPSVYLQKLGHSVFACLIRRALCWVHPLSFWAQLGRSRRYTRKPQDKHNKHSNIVLQQRWFPKTDLCDLDPTCWTCYSVTK